MLFDEILSSVVSTTTAISAIYKVLLTLYEVSAARRSTRGKLSAELRKHFELDAKVARPVEPHDQLYRKILESIEAREKKGLLDLNNRVLERYTKALTAAAQELTVSLDNYDSRRGKELLKSLREEHAQRQADAG